ncbi:hypothetical protein J3F83DRAFT_738978 [Trichoderma novae-zelandiae]
MSGGLLLGWTANVRSHMHLSSSLFHDFTKEYHYYSEVRDDMEHNNHPLVGVPRNMRKLQATQRIRTDIISYQSSKQRGVHVTSYGTDRHIKQYSACIIMYPKHHIGGGGWPKGRNADKRVLQGKQDVGSRRSENRRKQRRKPPTEITSHVIYSICRTQRPRGLTLAAGGLMRKSEREWVRIPGRGQISSQRWPLGETGGRLLSRAISCNAGEEIIGSWACLLGSSDKSTYTKAVRGLQENETRTDSSSGFLIVSSILSRSAKAP